MDRAINQKGKHLACPKSLIRLVETKGVEPSTSALRTQPLCQLSYIPKITESLELRNENYKQKLSILTSHFYCTPAGRSEPFGSDA